jgi:hypothetical protein
MLAREVQAVLQPTQRRERLVVAELIRHAREAVELPERARQTRPQLAHLLGVLLR